MIKTTSSLRKFHIIAIALLLCFFLVVGTLLTSVFAVKDEPLIDGKAFVATDGKTGAIVFHREEETQFKPKALGPLMVLSLLYEGGNLKKKEKELGQLANDNKIGDIKDFLKNVFDSEDKALALAKESLDKLQLKNTKLATLEGKSEGDITTLREAAVILGKLFSDEDILKEIDLKKEKKEQEVALKILAKGEKEDIYSLALGNKGDSYFIAINLGGATQEGNDEEVGKILDFSLKRYRTYKVVKKGEDVDKIKVKGGRKSYCKIIAASDLYITLPKEADNEIVKRKITIDKDLVAPVEKGINVGKLEALEAGEVTGIVNLVTKEAVVTGGPWSKIGISDYMMAIGSATLILLLIFIIIFKIRKKKKQKRLAKEREEKRRREELRIAKEKEEKRRRNWPY